MRRRRQAAKPRHTVTLLSVLFSVSCRTKNALGPSFEIATPTPVGPPER